MREYRIQSKYGDGWQFITDGHGNYYTYDTLASALRWGPTHYPRRYNPDTKKWAVNPDSGRIVYADIDWEVVVTD